VNRLYLSRVNTLKWVLGKSNDNDNDNNNLDKLKRIILCKIQQLKKEKKKTIYRIETIRIIQEIDNLEFCLNALVQHTNK
jgi:isoleucyl-tRNA synthetase